MWLKFRFIEIKGITIHRSIYLKYYFFHRWMFIYTFNLLIVSERSMNLRETGSRCQEIICISFKYIPTQTLLKITFLQFVHTMNVLGIDLKKYKSLEFCINFLIEAQYQIFSIWGYIGRLRFNINVHTRICDVTWDKK